MLKPRRFHQAKSASAETREPQRHRSPRIVAIDNLKSLLVAWIIANHAVVGYTAIGGWPYDEVNETTLPPPVEYVLTLVLGPTALFVIGTFFFLAGLFAPVELSHHGRSHFVKTRIVRLGLPWLIFMLLIWPFFMWLAYRSAGYDLTFWQVFRGRQPFLDSGPLWFVQILMYVSIGYALWNWLGWGRRLEPLTIRGMHLIAVAAGIAATSFVVRLWAPARSQQILDLHVWQLPQCVGMFCLGVLLSRHGWARQVPSNIARRCGITVAVTLVVAEAVAWGAGVKDFSREGGPFLGGWHWQALVLAMVEATLVVAGSLLLVAVAQRSLTSTSRLSAGTARGAYAAYILQVPVLLTLAIAARPLPLPATAKALLVGGLAVVASFGLGWLLTTRTKLGRIL